MILFFEYGRLGNQLFQYNGLKNYFPKHKLVFFGCMSLQATFNNIDANFINSENKYRNYLFKILKNFLYFLSSIRILGQIYQTEDNKSFKLKVFRGLFWNIYLAHDIYFQDNECIEKIHALPSLKKKNLRSAREFLKINKIDPKKSNLVFVHFRRGDYLSWPDPNYPAVLDLIWYKKAMLLIKKKITKPIFILMSDDLFYLKDSFEESKNLIISKNSYMVDLSIMSLCSSGILSASSFAWWGAYCSKLSNKKKNYFIGPKYWSGHRRKKWKPKNFYTKWIKYI